MFKIIEPKYHCFCMPTINHFIELINPRDPLWLSKREQNRATFILCDDSKHGVCGGAILLKKKLDDLPYALFTTMVDFISSKESIWESSVFLSFDQNSPLNTTNESNHYCQIFYRNLYNVLAEFGRKEGTGFLCISLDFGEYLYMEGMISWPYIFELKPQNSPDGCFHGILSLTGSQYEEYQRRWGSL